MRSEAGPSSKELKSESDLAKFLESSEAVVVSYLSSAAEKVKEVYHKVADGLKEELRFGHVSSDDLTKANKDKIVLHRPKRLHNKFESETVVCDASDVTTLKECINENVHGLVGHRTTSNAAAFKGPLLTVYYNVDYQKDPKGSNYWRNRVLKVISLKVFVDLVNQSINQSPIGLRVMKLQHLAWWSIDWLEWKISRLFALVRMFTPFFLCS